MLSLTCVFCTKPRESGGCARTWPEGVQRGSIFPATASCFSFCSPVPTFPAYFQVLRCDPHTPEDRTRSRTYQTHCQGNWYQVLGVRYLGATTEEIKRACKQLSVKLHPDKNAHHKEKAEGLFKQIGKAKDGLLDTEARRRHNADIQRGDRRQQREVRHCNRGAATHDPGQEGRRPGEPNTLTMQRRFAYATT